MITPPHGYRESDKFAALIYVVSIFRCNSAIRSTELLLPWRKRCRRRKRGGGGGRRETSQHLNRYCNGSWIMREDDSSSVGLLLYSRPVQVEVVHKIWIKWQPINHRRARERESALSITICRYSVFVLIFVVSLRFNFVSPFHIHYIQLLLFTHSESLASLPSARRVSVRCIADFRRKQAGRKSDNRSIPRSDRIPRGHKLDRAPRPFTTDFSLLRARYLSINTLECTNARQDAPDNLFDRCVAS